MDNYTIAENKFPFLAPLILLFSFLLSPIQIQSSIPPALDGLWYGGKKPVGGSVLIEAFIDPVCPDSRDSWPPLKTLLQKYGSKVSLVTHTFPLPYHDNAYATSRALHIVDKLNSSATYDVMEAFYAHQGNFFNSATYDLSRAATIDQIVTFVVKQLGTSYYSSIKSGFSDYKTDHATRLSFKYGCLRKVYGAPFFFVNGFPLPDAGSPLDYNEWRKVIDPLIRRSQGVREEDDSSPLVFVS